MKTLNEILPSDLNFTVENVKDLILLLGIETPCKDINSCYCKISKNLFYGSDYVSCFGSFSLYTDDDLFMFVIRCFFFPNETTIDYECLQSGKHIVKNIDITDLYTVGILSETVESCDLIVKKIRKPSKDI